MYDNVRTKQQKKTVSTDRLRCMAIRTKHQNKTVSTDSNAWQYRQNTRTRQCVQTQMFGITDKRPEQDSEYRLGCMAIQTKHQNQTASTDYMRCKVIRTKHQNKTVSTGSDVWQCTDKTPKPDSEYRPRCTVTGQNTRTRQWVQILMNGCATVRTDIELLFPCKWIEVCFKYFYNLHAEKWYHTWLLRRNDWKNLIATMCGGMEEKSKRENSLVRKVKVYHN